MFVTFEGPDGVGKTSVSLAVVQMLNERLGNGNTIWTCEPTKGKLGARARAQAISGVDPTFSALLFAADRYEHCLAEIIPALRAGENVVCDRYVHSTYAYQSDACEIGWLYAINAKAIAPDLVIVLDGEEGTLTRRLSSRGNATRFEFDQQARVRAYYKQLLAKNVVHVSTESVTVAEIATKCFEICSEKQSMLMG